MSGQPDRVRLAACFTRAEVAQHLAVSERTLRRALPTIPTVVPIKVGRAVRFTADDVQRITDHLRCQSTLAGNAPVSGMPEARSKSVRKQGSSPNTAQAALRERMQRERQERAMRKSARNSSVARQPAHAGSQ